MIRRVTDSTVADERWLKVSEAAKKMGISETKLRKLMRDKVIGWSDVADPAAEQRAQPRIPESEIRRYMASTYIAPNGDTAREAS